MRFSVVVAVLAISGVPSVAAEAIPMFETPSIDVALPSPTTVVAPVRALDPAALPVVAFVQAASLVGDPVTDARVPARDEAERLAYAPRFELLSGGEIFISYDPGDVGEPLARDVLLREPLAAPAAALPSKPLSTTPLPVPREAGARSSEIARALRGPLAAPTGTESARVFDPRPTNVVTLPGLAVGGTLAFATLAGVGVLLYHRIRPHAALENETRKIIFDAVCSMPGLGVHEIGRIARVSYSTATYHLERLVAAGMIVMTPDGNKLCYYKNGGAFSESERRILPLVKNEEAAKLFEAILRAPGTYRAALAEQLGVTATTINWHLRRLREAGLVDETRTGRSAHLYARMDSLRPTFLALASKVEEAEPSTAKRLRVYAAAGAPSGGFGAA